MIISKFIVYIQEVVNIYFNWLLEFLHDCVYSSYCLLGSTVFTSVGPYPEAEESVMDWEIYIDQGYKNC